MRRYISGSRLPLQSKCAASGALDSIDHETEEAEIGTAIHEHAADRAVFGMTGAIERLGQISAAHGFDDKKDRVFRIRALECEWSPPPGAIPEIALCLRESGEVVRVKGGQGQYDELPDDFVFPTQIDLMWAEPNPLRAVRDEQGQIVRVVCPPDSVLCVLDIKTGDDVWVDPVELGGSIIDGNAQVLGEAVLAAKWTGAKAVMPMILFWRKGPGVFDIPDSPPLDDAGIAAGEARLRKIVAGHREQVRRALIGETLSYTTGTQCRWCDSRPFCVAHSGEIRLLMGELLEDAKRPGANSLEFLQRLATFEPQLRQAAEASRQMLKDGVKVNKGEPLPMKDGKGWGQYEMPGASIIDPDIARAVLAKEIGAEAALSAGHLTSRPAIEAAITKAHQRAGIKRQAGSALGRVMGAIDREDGIKRTTRKCFGLVTLQDGAAVPYPAASFEDIDER